MRLANLGFTEEDLDHLADPHWRLRNLYYIVDRNANVIPFRPNAAQESLLANLHHRNVVLKARQRGFCLDPDTRVLTADRRWVRIDDIRPGDALVSVDEDAPDCSMRTAIVVARGESHAAAYRITFDNGRAVVCSGGHRWLTRTAATGVVWSAISDRLTVDAEVRCVTSREDGWSGGWATVAAIERLDERRLVDIQTTTGTFIAEGFVSHNSSLIQLMGLDQALFNENYTVGIIAHTLDDASKFLDRIEFAYNSLPEAIRSAVRMVKRNESTIRFSNGSRIDVDTSMRGGTLQFLHVSEFGKICAKYPDKAREIMTGTLPALAPTGIGFIESTAEGHSGHFFDIVTAARAKAQLGAKLNRLDFKFHFYSWWDEDEYRLPADSVTLTLDELAYCSQIEAAIGTKLEPERWAWYWAQRRILGESMFQEHPSVPEEAFWHSVEGRYYTEQIKAVRLQKRLGDFPHLPDRAVNTVWDIGANDETAIWCWQYAGSRFRLINYHERSGEPFSYFVNWLQSLGYTWGVHYLPHDAEHKRQQGLVVQSAIDMLEDLAPGWRFEIVDRIPDITVGIQQTRNLFPLCEFDEVGTALGFARLEAYRKEWSERHATWKSTPFHGPESNGADAFRALAQLFAAGELRFPAPMRDNIRRPRGNWRTA